MAVLSTICFHPSTQAKYLIQLGYEPVAPHYKPAATFLSKPCYVRPGLFTGLTSMGKRQGYLGACNLLSSENITRGMGISITEVVAKSLVQTALTKPLEQAFPEKPEDESLDQTIVDCVRESLQKSAATITCQPLKVIAIRQIAGLANGTQKSILETIKEGGLFNGLVPQLAFEIGLIWIVRVSMHFYKKNAESFGDKDKKNHWMIEMIINFATTQMLYPLKLVSTMQAAGGAGGLETFPELGWLSILAELRARQEQMRGSSILSDRKVAPPPEPVAPVVVETPPPVAPVVVDTPPPVEPVVAQTAVPIEKTE